jgi:hypothetical protein
MRKSSKLLALFICVSFFAGAQVANCKLVRDTVYYVSFDIRGKGEYPVQMNGVVKKFRLNDFKKGDKSAFLSSFYKKSFYTPEFFNGYKKMLRRCLGDSLANKHLKENRDLPGSMIDALNKHSLKEKLILESGETVFFSISRITADFWVVDKNDKGLSTNSDEAELSDIPEIAQCYIPFKIYKCTTPKRTEKLE